MEHILIQSLILSILLIIGSECQEYMTLNIPSRPPFMYHETEQLAMDVSEMHPVFLYSSSQNDFVHQHLPDHHAVPPPNLSRPRQRQRQRQRQNNSAKPKFTNPPSPVSQNQRNSKPRNSPQLTYGFQPKPSSNRQVSQHAQKVDHSNSQKKYQNEVFRIRRPQEPIYQDSIRHTVQQAQHQNKQFAEHIQVQSHGHRNRQKTNTMAPPSYQDGFSDLNQPFNYLAHILAPEKQSTSAPPPYNRPNINNHGYRNTEVENRKNVGNHERFHKSKEEKRQESVRKPSTFEDSSTAFKNRYNSNQANDGTYPPKILPDINNEQSVPQNKRNKNERINMQEHARSMRGNKPQLPPRPSFNNGGIRINTLAGELPILRFDSVSAINENPAVYLQNNNRNDRVSLDEQEKKTYLLIKAPSLVTTERPSSAPFVIEGLKQTTAPYIVNNYAETTLNIPEITHSTQPEPRSLPESAESPAIVLDLVQIPDHAIYKNHEERHSPPPPPPEPRPEFRSAVREYRSEQSVHPTESYPTTPMRDTYDDVMYHINNAYHSHAEEGGVKHQNNVLPKPRIKDFHKSNFTSSLHPITYSSSVSVVSVKQSVENKQPPARKQKTSSKKTSSSKKKQKILDKEKFSYDDYEDGHGVPGDPGVDYPTHKDIPATNFECGSAKSPGFYADVETGCQVFHNCDTGMAKHSFMCPNGTIFHQELLICDWWYNVKCEDSPEFYSLNSGVYITNNAHDESRRKA